jgi:hypothetical protein
MPGASPDMLNAEFLHKWQPLHLFSAHYVEGLVGNDAGELGSVGNEKMGVVPKRAAPVRGNVD